MAKISYIIIPEGLEDIFNKTLKPGDRYQYPRVYLRNNFMSRKRKKGVTQRSLLPFLAEQWDSLNDTQRAAWNSAAAVSGLTGWRLFVSDTTWRHKLDIGGLAIPSLHHQSLVGRIVLDPTADYVFLSQLHPLDYWVQKKITGTKNSYQPVQVREYFSLPLSIGISYTSDLVATGPEPVARFYADVKSDYQGRTLQNIVEIPFDLQSDWVTVMDSIGSVVGRSRGYSLYIELRNVSGTIQFDNIKAIHSSENWARDFRCNSVSTSFTRAFFQIPRNWGIIEIADGVFFRSDYPDD